MIKNRPPDKIDNDGDKYWWDEYGITHNDNGFPAFISKNGYRAWYKHGKCHNENGPAIIFSSGRKEWYIDNIQYTEKEFKQYKIKQFITQ